MIPQYRTLKLKLPKYRVKKSPIPQYRKPPCPPPFVLAELGQMSRSSSRTKICTPQTAASLYSAFESWRYFNVMLLNTFSCNKRRKNCEESRWLSPRALVWPSAKSLTVRSQNLIGSYVSTHSTFNLIGPCNRHPHIQSQKATKIHTPKPLTYELFFQNISKRVRPVQSPLFKFVCPNKYKLHWDYRPVWMRCRSVVIEPLCFNWTILYSTFIQKFLVLQ